MNDVLQLFRDTGALLEGHFILRSGLHSRQYFQCALLLRQTPAAVEVCGQLTEKLRHLQPEEVISPAMGGLFVGHETARVLGLPHTFVEKEDGKLVLRRGFTIEAGRRYLVVEDVVTRGGRVQETLEIIREAGGTVVGVGTIVDRSGSQKPEFGCPFLSLVEMEVKTFSPDALPPDLAQVPPTKPGSK